MCDLSGPFKLCTCDDDIDENKPYWCLETNLTDRQEGFEIYGTMADPFNREPTRGEKLEVVLNSRNVFDFEYSPKENDCLTFYYNEDNFDSFEFLEGSWKEKASLGVHTFDTYERVLRGHLPKKKK
ncbi:MAG: hypothetical protein ACPHXR_09380 [Flavicella sp.]